MSRLGRPFRALTARLRGMPTAVQGGLALLLLAGVVVASVLMYRTYDYVQHDNEFCLSCHLMREPFERFAQSAHRGLGCKACHRPNIVERSTMGLAQIIDQPDSIRVHAHVPNRICAECHIEGDPEEWRRIANTAGHRVHLESTAAELDGLMCVECHSSSVHEFAPVDRTCGQAGCHEGIDIRLGDMADLTIHCAACHDFARPVAQTAPAETLAVALRPHAEECLSCHAMRTMMANLPADEPHGAECGACHNPHEQLTPQEAVASCATSGCHSRADTLTAYHRGLPPGVLDGCTSCHEAHDFRVHDAANCLACHAGILDDAGQQRVTAAGANGGRFAHAPTRLPAAHPPLSNRRNE